MNRRGFMSRAVKAIGAAVCAPFVAKAIPETPITKPVEAVTECVFTDPWSPYDAVYDGMIVTTYATSGGVLEKWEVVTPDAHTHQPPRKE